jgi:2-methylcitrate dehydratase PrpD
LQLSADQMTQALSIAFVTTPSHACLVSWGASLGQQAAPWHKYAMYGAIAEAGVNAALLARGGFVGGSGVLDRGSGFWRAFGAADFDWDTFYADLGHRWYIAETSIKPYPFCRYGNAALDLFGAVMKENGLAPTDVDEVVVTVAPYDWLVMLFGTEPPASAIDAAFCLPFAFAMLASNIPAGPDWQSLENLENTDLAAFARKVRHEVEPQWREGLETQIREVGRFRRMPVRVEVLAGGRIHAMQTDCAKGDPYAETRLSDDELALKVHNFCDKALTPGRVDELIAVAYALVEHTSVTTLTGLLSN